jgi:small subunit ribosomal protein S8
MNVNDPIADLLTRIRNAQKARHDILAVPASKAKIAIVHILKHEGMIKNYKCIRDDQQGVIKIALKYQEDGEGAITELKRISRPSRRTYVKAKSIPYVRNGFGIGILSTSNGVMTDRDARKLGVGGELICTVY